MVLYICRYLHPTVDVLGMKGRGFVVIGRRVSVSKHPGRTVSCLHLNAALETASNRLDERVAREWTRNIEAGFGDAFGQTM